VVLGLLVAAAVTLPSGGPAAAAPAAAPTAVVYRAPIAPPWRVVRSFVGPAAPWAAGHRGIDLDTQVGAPVLAPVAGTVAVAGTIVDRGVVTIVDAAGRRNSLEPVTPGVRVGQQVTIGEVVATVSAERSHCAGTCLHWGVREGLNYLDPLALLPGGGPIVLLPTR